MADLMEVHEEKQKQFGFAPDTVLEAKLRKRQAKAAFKEGFVMKLGSDLK